MHFQRRDDYNMNISKTNPIRQLEEKMIKPVVTNLECKELVPGNQS